MSNAEDLKEDIEVRISGHRLANPFQPTVTYNQYDYPDEVVVNYFVDLLVGDRAEYAKNYFDGDRNWVEGRGGDYNLTATLYCKWKT